MAQGGFRVGADGQVEFLLGPPGDELVLSSSALAHIVAPFEERMGTQRARARNVIGEGFKENQADYMPTYRLNLMASQRNRDAVRSLLAINDTPLSFVFADDWANYSERYLTEDATTFTLRTNPFQRLDEMYDDLSLSAIIGNFAVHKTRNMEGAQSDFDYYTGGSYNRATRLVTMGTTPGAADTEVFVTYTFKGCRVEIAGSPSARTVTSFISGARAVVIPLSLESV